MVKETSTGRRCLRVCAGLPHAATHRVSKAPVPPSVHLFCTLPLRSLRLRPAFPAPSLHPPARGRLPHPSRGECHEDHQGAARWDVGLPLAPPGPPYFWGVVVRFDKVCADRELSGGTWMYPLHRLDLRCCCSVWPGGLGRKEGAYGCTCLGPYYQFNIDGGALSHPASPKQLLHAAPSPTPAYHREAASAFGEASRERRISKTYVAMVRGYTAPTGKA